VKAQERFGQRTFRSGVLVTSANRIITGGGRTMHPVQQERQQINELVTEVEAKTARGCWL
jgi:hypothetical protein